MSTHTKQWTKRAITLLLALSMLLGMLPMSALAAGDQTIDPIIFKNMQMYSETNHRPISTYFCEDQNNYFHTPLTTINGGRNLEWSILAFSIQFSQDVDLVLYEANDEYAWDNPTELQYDLDDQLEEFLNPDMRIGYLSGYNITGNYEPDPAQGDGYFKFKDFSPQDFDKAVSQGKSTYDTSSVGIIQSISAILTDV